MVSILLYLLYKIEKHEKADFACDRNIIDSDDVGLCDNGHHLKTKRPRNFGAFKYLI